MKKDFKTYIGKPCRRHGHTLRYAATRKCVQCNIDDSAKRNKLRAASKESTPVAQNPSPDTSGKLLAMRW